MRTKYVCPKLRKLLCSFPRILRTLPRTFHHHKLNETSKAPIDVRRQRCLANIASQKIDHCLAERVQIRCWKRRFAGQDFRRTEVRIVRAEPCPVFSGATMEYVQSITKTL